jgi:thiopeptide-type bacteriocin biosynthesis protein
MTFPIDLDNVLSVEAMVASLADRKSATLTELWPGPERLVAREDHGHLVSELVVPFSRRKRVLPPRKASMREIELLERDARVLALDSEWLYVKLYTGETLADQVLRAVAPTALATGAVDRWFFVRYRDQGHHVRLRFHGEPGALRSVVLPAVEAAVKPLLARGTVLRISLDTYERELERYGGSRGIELAERIFHVDSEAVLELLSQLEPGDRGAEERWQIALLGASTLLDDMRLGADAEIRLLERLREAFGAEFRADAALGRALSGRLRAHRSMLTALVEGRESDAAALAPGIRTLRRRSAALEPLLDELRALDTDRTLTKGIPELGESYVHMHLNRIFRSAQRAQELVIYDFLLRLRSSSRARSFGAAKDATLPGSKAGGGADRNRDAPDRRRA